jgi:hypothetical protein
MIIHNAFALKKAAIHARSSFRKDKFDYLDEQYMQRMDQLNIKYQGIKWLPLDIPKLVLSNQDYFLQTWAKEAVDSVRLNPDVAEPWTKEDHPKGLDSTYYNAAWRSLSIYHANPENFLADQTQIWKLKYVNHPAFYQIIFHAFTYLPFKHIEHIYIWESITEILPHCDQTYFWSAPTDFRIMLTDDNPEPTMYVCDLDTLEMNYIDLPPDTNSFCWSNGTQMHGSNYLGHTKHNCIVNGIICPDKMEKLIDKSILKYRDKLNYKLDL